MCQSELIFCYCFTCLLLRLWAGRTGGCHYVRGHNITKSLSLTPLTFLTSVVSEEFLLTSPSLKGRKSDSFSFLGEILLGSSCLLIMLNAEICKEYRFILTRTILADIQKVSLATIICFFFCFKHLIIDLLNIFLVAARTFSLIQWSGRPTHSSLITLG